MVDRVYFYDDALEIVKRSVKEYGRKKLCQELRMSISTFNGKITSRKRKKGGIEAFYCHEWEKIYELLSGKTWHWEYINQDIFPAHYTDDMMEKAYNDFDVFKKESEI